MHPAFNRLLLES